MFEFESKSPPLKEDFNYHSLTLVLAAGQGEGELEFKVECKGADKADCSCHSRYCAVEDTIKMVGLLDVLKVAGDIELVKLSARMDYTDQEEPWIEVEP